MSNNDLPWLLSRKIFHNTRHRYGLSQLKNCKVTVCNRLGPHYTHECLAQLWKRFSSGSMAIIPAKMKTEFIKLSVWPGLILKTKWPNSKVERSEFKFRHLLISVELDTKTQTTSATGNDGCIAGSDSANRKRRERRSSRVGHVKRRGNGITSISGGHVSAFYRPWKKLFGASKSASKAKKEDQFVKQIL